MTQNQLNKLVSLGYYRKTDAFDGIFYDNVPESRRTSIFYDAVRQYNISKINKYTIKYLTMTGERSCYVYYFPIK